MLNFNINNARRPMPRQLKLEHSTSSLQLLSPLSTPHYDTDASKFLQSSHHLSPTRQCDGPLVDQSSSFAQVTTYSKLSPFSVKESRDCCNDGRSQQLTLGRSTIEDTPTAGDTRNTPNSSSLYVQRSPQLYYFSTSSTTASPNNNQMEDKGSSYWKALDRKECDRSTQLIDGDAKPLSNLSSCYELGKREQDSQQRFQSPVNDSQLNKPHQRIATSNQLDQTECANDKDTQSTNLSLSAPSVASLPRRSTCNANPSFPPVSSEENVATNTQFEATFGSSVQFSPQEQYYAFRKRMRQVFEHIDEMVDHHRQLFRVDPETGIPSYNHVASEHAAQFSSIVFRDLQLLRDEFHQLTTKFQQLEDNSQQYPQNASVGKHLPSIRITTPSHTKQDYLQLVPTKYSDQCDPVEYVDLPANSMVDDFIPNDLQQDHIAPHSIETSQKPISRQESINQTIISSAAARECHLIPPRDSSQIFADFDERMQEIRRSLQAVVQTKPLTQQIESHSMKSFLPSQPCGRDEKLRHLVQQLNEWIQDPLSSTKS